jgi:hydroxymethylglutaryl-CoA reductase
MKNKEVPSLSGFSKLSKNDKLNAVASVFHDPQSVAAELQSFWHDNAELQKRFDEFSENTISNFVFPYGVVPNFMLNGKRYLVPMVIEESSVVAAASKSAKFWADKGGFRAEIVGTEKLGQVHFIWNGSPDKLEQAFPHIRQRMIDETAHITENMRKRGGGVTDIELVNRSNEEPGYFQFKARFETCDSMGANFINSCLEEFASIFKDWCESADGLSESERKPHIIMSILSNYTPQCLVRAWVECPMEQLGEHEGMSPQEFAWKFEKAVRVAQLDVHRATTHNKGIFNGIDAVVLATGNDFRAVEACGHTHAASSGKYSSLTYLEKSDSHFKYVLEIPMALGVVGGLTGLHPLVKRSLEMLGNPSAPELMQIAACLGLANNFGALRSLTTTGIQKGHMKMHLLNILNHFSATDEEKNQALEYFKTVKVSFSAVRQLLENLRGTTIS